MSRYIAKASKKHFFSHLRVTWRCIGGHVISLLQVKIKRPSKRSNWNQRSTILVNLTRQDFRRNTENYFFTPYSGNTAKLQLYFGEIEKNRFIFANKKVSHFIRTYALFSAGVFSVHPARTAARHRPAAWGHGRRESHARRPTAAALLHGQRARQRAHQHAHHGARHPVRGGGRRRRGRPEEKSTLSQPPPSPARLLPHHRGRHRCQGSPPHLQSSTPNRCHCQHLHPLSPHLKSFNHCVYSHLCVCMHVCVCLSD